MSAAAERVHYCSFCGRTPDEAGSMIVGDSAKICEVCIEMCNVTMRRQVRLDAEWERLKDYAP